jgi:hypothetical protein
LVRAPALQAGCRGFESLSAHHHFLEDSGHLGIGQPLGRLLFPNPITSEEAVIGSESAARVSVLTSIRTSIPSAPLDDVSFELLRRSEQPTAVVRETICEQVHG